MKIFFIILILVMLLPFYSYILSKAITLGRLQIIKDFTINNLQKEQKENQNKEKEEQNGKKENK